MAVPKAVQKQVEEASRLQEEMYRNPEETEVEAAPEEESEEVVETESHQEEVKEPVEEPEPRETKDDGSYWKQRFEVMQGKYNAEVPRMSEQITDLTKKIDSLQSQPEPEPEQVTYLTPDQVEEYGEDFVDFGRNIAKEETATLRAENESLRAKLDSLQETVTSVEGRQKVSEEERFYNALNSSVPDWGDINTNDNFLQWLSETDPLVGQTRYDLLQSAYQSLDASRVSSFFNAWKGTQSEPPKEESDLEEQVTPSRTRQSATQPTEKKTWTPADIHDFYDKVRRGKISPKEAQRRERDMFAAQREQRIAV